MSGGAVDGGRTAAPENLDFNGPNLFQIAEKHGATVSIEVKEGSTP